MMLQIKQLLAGEILGGVKTVSPEGAAALTETDILTQLAWSTDEANTILGAMDELEEIPIIPASYSVTRNVMNAFRDVVNNNENPRDTLMSYNRDINEEITRKRENLGLDS